MGQWVYRNLPVSQQLRNEIIRVESNRGLRIKERDNNCRRRGVFPEQILAWRHDCEQAASLSQHERRHEALDAKAQRQRIRELERDLRRKNAALAETAALLTLSKKAAAIWGDEES